MSEDDEGHCRPRKQTEKPWYSNVRILHIKFYSGYSKNPKARESTAKLPAATSLPTAMNGVEHTKLEALEVVTHHYMKESDVKQKSAQVELHTLQKAYILLP